MDRFGGSGERRLAFDGFGNVIQEAVRLSGTNENAKWRINRTVYDLLQRPVVIQSFADPVYGNDPPAADTPIEGSRSEQRYWYFGNKVWEQFPGSKRHHPDRGRPAFAAGTVTAGKWNTGVRRRDCGREPTRIAVVTIRPPAPVG